MQQPQTLDGRYQVVQKLSEGGFGVTYLARDTRRPGQPMCVAKELRHEHQGTPKIIQLFHQEAEMLETLGRHDQIPQLLASFHHEDRLYLVQEYIEGTTLEDELRSPSGDKLQKSEAEVVSLLRDVLTVLAFVHQHQVVHRDIKPANLIRRRRDGKFMLIDFGAVKALTKSQVSANGRITTTVSIGSPGYSPHEQVSQGNPRPASDIYALGMTAIEALTGLYPTELWTDPDTAQLVWKDRVQISPKLEALLTQMVQHHFSRRFSNAEAAIAALDGNTSTPTIISTTPVVRSPVVRSPQLLQPVANITPVPAPTSAVVSDPAGKPQLKPRRDVLKFLGFLITGVGLTLGGQQLLRDDSVSRETETTASGSDTTPSSLLDTNAAPETNETPSTREPEPPVVDPASSGAALTEQLPWLNGTATAEISVNGGTIKVELDGEQAPFTAGNFVDLARRGVYDGTTFHRVVKSPDPFVVQGGDPQSTDPTVPRDQLGTGGYIDPDTGEPRLVPLEILVTGEAQPRYGETLDEIGVSNAPVLTHRRGAIAMARSGPNTASSQFYIALADLPFLDGIYAVFGYVTEGMSVVDSIQADNVITSVNITTGEDQLIQPASS